jgi:hypothetical protein
MFLPDDARMPPLRGWRISNAVSIPRLARHGLNDHARYAGWLATVLILAPKPSGAAGLGA